MGSSGAIEEERIAEAFDRMDTDSSGFISPENLRQLLGDKYTEEDIDNIMKNADENKDGKISFEEFKKIFKVQTGKHVAGFLEEDDESGSLVGVDAEIPGGRQ